jgi:hypothetical protein
VACFYSAALAWNPTAVDTGSLSFPEIMDLDDGDA